MGSVVRAVISQRAAYGPRGGEYRLLTLECGHTAEDRRKSLLPLREAHCPRCSSPDMFVDELGLAPSHEAALCRLFREKQVRSSDASGVELRALRALVEKGLAVESTELGGETIFESPNGNDPPSVLQMGKVGR